MYACEHRCTREHKTHNVYKHTMSTHGTDTCTHAMVSHMHVHSCFQMYTYQSTYTHMHRPMIPYTHEQIYMYSPALCTCMHRHTCMNTYFSYRHTEMYIFNKCTYVYACAWIHECVQICMVIMHPCVYRYTSISTQVCLYSYKATHVHGHVSHIHVHR